METGALKRRLPAAHPTGVYSVLPLTEKLMASGDDDGTVKCKPFGVRWRPSRWGRTVGSVRIGWRRGCGTGLAG